VRLREALRLDGAPRAARCFLFLETKKLHDLIGGTSPQDAHVVADDLELSGFDSVPAWTMEAHDLDDLESSLRYLEREDRGAWEHVKLLLSELREDVR
jgi:hypothetical protein